MSLTDPIADFLAKLHNAVHAQKETVDIPASKLIEKILQLFKNDGYIENFRLLKDNRQGILKVYLRYEKGYKSAIMGLRRVSRPGLRIYARKDNVPRVLNGLGTAVISTSKGVLTDREARKLRLGGEVLCFIW